jgi:glycosyltransferase involved in cell wall biosynthesis
VFAKVRHGAGRHAPGEGQLRVLHVITPSRMAGAETLLVRLTHRQSARGIAVQVVANRNSRALGALRAAGLMVEGLRIGGKLNLLAPLSLKRAIRRSGSHILHSHLSTASWWCGWLEKLGGPPTLGHVHGFTSAVWHRRQRHLVTCSQAVKRHLVGQGIAARRITVLLNPVDPADISPQRQPEEVRAELGANHDVPIIGCFAHFSVKKGWRDLAAAAPHVLRRFPKAQFWCVGDGPLRPEIERWLADHGIANQFRFLGFRQDVGDLMNAIDLLVLPSHREPFGLVYVEAALLGKPAIGCLSGGAPEVITDQETGLLVPPRDVPALAEAILTLLDNRDRASAMGRSGRQLALERFDWQRYLRGLDEIYEQLRAESR